MANFKKLINFPSKVDFRVIVLDVPDIENTVISFFAERFDLKVETPIAKKPSKNGTYYSLSVNSHTDIHTHSHTHILTLIHTHSHMHTHSFIDTCTHTHS